MSQASDYLEQVVCDIITGRRPVPSAAATNRWLSLHTANPADDASGTEVSGTSYARQQITNSTGPVYSFPAASGTGGSVTNSTAAVTFPAAGGSWGTVTHFAYWDASSGGNMLAHGALGASQAINTGNVLQFNTSTLTVTVA